MISRPDRIKKIAHLVPFVAVGIGLLIANNAWVAIILYHLGMGVFLILGKQGYRARELVMGGKLLPILLAIISGVAVGVILLAFANGIGVPNNLAALLAQQGLQGPGWILFIIYYSFVNPFLEEYYWRGYLAESTKGITLSDICYAGYHPFVLSRYLSWPWLILEFLVLLGVAWAWRQIAQRYAGLIIPVITHLAADLSLIIAIYILVQS
jgi:membrane protease YdiL (CAAX protease family)